MLHLLLGRAGAGKTKKMLELLRCAVNAERGNQVVLVPDQYSHDMERALCREAGDRAALFAEVLSFKRLANRVFAQAGGLAVRQLDEGGRLLTMGRALGTVADRLRFFRAPQKRPEFLRELVDTMDELKCYRVLPDALRRAAEAADPFVADKLTDLALIFEAYDALTAQLALDPRELYVRLEEKLRSSGYAQGRTFYIDGFAGFTPQEAEVVFRLLDGAQDLWVLLTCESLETPEGDFFARTARTGRMLRHYAESRGIPWELETARQSREVPPELKYLEEKLYDYDAPAFEGVCPALSAFEAENPLGECELAAAEILRLVREEGVRYRDIAVAARDFSPYEMPVRTVFSRYGIPLFEDETEDLLQKPVLTLVLSALDAVRGGYAYEPVFRYLKSGLADLKPDQVDRLENYVLTWNIRGARWKRPWDMNPGGFDGLPASPEELGDLNQLRERVMAPLERFERAAQRAACAGDYGAALFGLLEDLHTPEQISSREERLRDLGELKQAEEYRQLWDILCRALDQCVETLGEAELALEEFCALFRLVLSQYRVGTIPVSLDRVTAGSADRMRRRGVKVLFVLGATDDMLPLLSGERGLLSEGDREFLSDMGLELAPWGAGRVEQELYVIYTLFTLPEARLYVGRPLYRGEETRPSFLLPRLKELFPKLKEVRQESLGGAWQLAALRPCLQFAASGGTRGALWEENRRLARAALGELPGERERLELLEYRSFAVRGPLRPDTVKHLFGNRLRMSASRMDRYRSCKFSYLMQYGLKLRPRRQAKFDAPAAGTFVHYMLEHIVREVRDRGGVDKVSPKEVEELIGELTLRYVQESLGGLENKSARFRHLFFRLAQTVKELARSVLEELARSNFVPLDFELHFAPQGDLPPVEVPVDEETTLAVSGFVDRVDGFFAEDRLYLRVMDYKSGMKSFQLSDVWHGLGIQMLLYLFALEQAGEGRYGKKVVPAGVLYVPVREPVLRGRRDFSEEEVSRELSAMLRRSGLVLDDPKVVDAMEKGIEGTAKYLPVKRNRDGGFDVRSSLASLEKFGALRRHVEKLLKELGQELNSGRVEADPFWKGQRETACDYCDFQLCCQFDPTNGCDKMRYLNRMDAGEFWERTGGEDRGGETD